MFFALIDRFLAAAPAELTADSLLMRSLGAGLSVMLLVIAAGPAAIAWLSLHCREPIKSGSQQLDRLHAGKAATPTMGGLLLVGAMCAAVMAFGNLHDRAIMLALVVTVGLALLGAIDDLIKLRTAGAGLRWKQKLGGQLVVALIPAVCCYAGWCDLGGTHPAAAEAAYAGALPAWTMIPWIVLVIVATSNAVNIADGLDGLAAGCLLLPALAIAVVGYLTHHGAGREMVVAAAALCGGVIGFLPFNRHPARVFMGNVGALPLGGLLGFLALATHTELLLALAGGVLVAEAASVLLQIGSYRLTGNRIFRCAPLHHHFEFKGWAEPTIVRRFWIASAVCAAVGTAIFLALPAADRATDASQIAAHGSSAKR